MATAHVNTPEGDAGEGHAGFVNSQFLLEKMNDMFQTVKQDMQSMNDNFQRELREMKNKMYDRETPSQYSESTTGVEQPIHTITRQNDGDAGSINAQFLLERMEKMFSKVLQNTQDVANDIRTDTKQMNDDLRTEIGDIKQRLSALENQSNPRDVLKVTNKHGEHAEHPKFKLLNMDLFVENGSGDYKQLVTVDQIDTIKMLPFTITNEMKGTILGIVDDINDTFQVVRNRIQEVQDEVKRDMNIFKTELQSEMRSMNDTMKSDIQCINTQYRIDVQEVNKEIEHEIQALKAELMNIKINAKNDQIKFDQCIQSKILLMKSEITTLKDTQCMNDSQKVKNEIQLLKSELMNVKDQAKSAQSKFDKHITSEMHKFKVDVLDIMKCEIEEGTEKLYHEVIEEVIDLKNDFHLVAKLVTRMDSNRFHSQSTNHRQLNQNVKHGSDIILKQRFNVEPANSSSLHSECYGKYQTNGILDPRNANPQCDIDQMQHLDQTNVTQNPRNTFPECDTNFDIGHRQNHDVNQDDKCSVKDMENDQRLNGRSVRPKTRM